MTLGLLFTAFGLGLRHGVDWDHIAAIADLTSTTESKRRGFMLSLWYALGHAAVVLVLGIAAISLERTIPDGLDSMMGRVVGLTLVVLGVWVLVDLRRHGDDFRLRSRWMLILDGTFAGLRRVRESRGRRRISIEHEHSHTHDGELDHAAAPAHDHAHDPVHEQARVHGQVAAPLPAGSGGGVRRVALPSMRRHRHAHRHDLELPTDVSAGYAPGVAGGIGMLHGIGVESPTQIAVFVAATSVGGQQAGLALLLAWVVGLVVANAGLAVVAGQGLLQPGTHARLYKALAVLVAIASIGMGVFYLRG